MAKQIKVGRVPGTVVEVNYNEGMKVSELLEIANLSAEGYELRLDGATVSEDTQVYEGTNLLLVEKIKGNQSSIKVGKVPGAIVEVFVAEDTSVGEAIELAGLDPQGYELRLDGATVNEAEIIGEDAQNLLLVEKIKGNK